MKLSRKLSFASADIFGGGSFNIFNFMYPGFLALVVGLNPFLCSLVMLIGGIYDAINDPVMGAITDRTKNKKFGKRRIYLIIAAPLILVTFFFAFFPFSFSSEVLRFTAVLLAYLAFLTVQTMTMIPYYSLASEITSDYTNRASANAVRLMFSLFASILCVAVAPLIATTDNPSSYITMSLIFGVLFSVCILITGLWAREEIVAPPVKTKFSYKEVVKPFKLQSFRHYFGMFILLQLTMAIMSGLFFFFVDFYFVKDLTAAGETNMVATIGAALMFLVQIIALPFYMWVIKKYNKAMAYRLGAFIWILVSVVVFFLPSGSPHWVLYLIALLIGFGISGPGLAPHAMFGDIADEAALQNGERMDGLMSGIANFCSRIAQAVGLAIMMAVLGFCGFITAQPGEIITKQPDSALLALRIMLCVAPIIFLSLGVFLSTRYKLNKKRHEEISAELKEKQIGKSSLAET